MKQVFISYSRLDRMHALRVSDSVRALDWSAFLDEEDIPPGSAWRDKIHDALSSSDLFVLVLTPRWGDSEWARLELSVYSEMKGSKAGNSILPLEFEEVSGAKHMTPVLHATQIVRGASELTDPELRWVLLCGGEAKALGPRQQWATRGLEVTKLEGVAPRALSPAERLRLEDELSSRYPSVAQIREIVRSVFGDVFPELSPDPRTAWYQVVERANDLHLIERLCEVSNRGMSIR